MRLRLFSLATIAIFVAQASAQVPGGGFNQGGPPPGGPQGGFHPGGPGMMGPPQNVMFDAIDVDGDGIITKAELRKAIVALRKLDADGDGNITRAEVSPMGGPMGDPAQMVDRLLQGDRDGDGKLTAEELPGPIGERMLQDGDTNGDGALDRDELLAALQIARDRFGGGQVPGAFPNGQPGFQGGPQGFRGGPGGANFDPQQMTGRMMQFDRNGDGKLSADELPPQAQGMLRGADQNGDGFIEPGEMQAVAERMGERMRGNMGRANRGRFGQPNRDAPQNDNPGDNP